MQIEIQEQKEILHDEPEWVRILKKICEEVKYQNRENADQQ